MRTVPLDRIGLSSSACKTDALTIELQGRESQRRESNSREQPYEGRLHPMLAALLQARDVRPVSVRAL